MTEPTSLLKRCVAEYYMSAGCSPTRMADVLRYLSDELLRDAFCYDHTENPCLLLDASLLRKRLLTAAESIKEPLPSAQ
ncbi:hypothetical protein EBZ39_19675 [bacterium]|nr:hypothetical protein [bacterium]